MKDSKFKNKLIEFYELDLFIQFYGVKISIK